MAGLSIEVLIAIGALVVVLLGVGLTVGIRSRRAPKLPTDSPLQTQLDETTGAPPVGADEPAAGVTAPTLERPEAAATRMQRLRARLARSGGLGQAILNVLSRVDRG